MIVATPCTREDTVDLAPLEFGQQEVGCKERIADGHAGGFESVNQEAQQRF